MYHVLEAESLSRGKGILKAHLAFPFSKGFIGRLRSKIRPAENAGVTTFAHDANSRTIPLKDAEPGDIITMVGGPDTGERDHILLIHQIDFIETLPAVIHYTHAMAWPSDGEYGHGVRQGMITMIDSRQNITDQNWIEAEKTGSENYTFTRAQKSDTQIRRLNWL